jgi:signal peptidase I
MLNRWVQSGARSRAREEAESNSLTDNALAARLVSGPLRTTTWASVSRVQGRRRGIRRPAPLSLALVLSVAGSSAVAAGAVKLVDPPMRRVQFPYTGARVNSSSMEPTLHCAKGLDIGCRGRRSDLLLQQQSRAAGLRRGDIVSFTLPRQAAQYCQDAHVGDLGVKRVIGLPGDVVVEEHGVMTVSRRRLSEPYVPSAERSDHSGRWRVPARAVFVAGDNRAVSCDSRYWGPLPESDVKSKVVEIIRAGRDGSDPIGPPILHVPYPYQASLIPGGAMEPTIHCARPRQFCQAARNDLVIDELSGHRGVRRGDIILFRLPASATPFCGAGGAFERVIGLPGERLTEKRGVIYVHGRRLPEPYIPTHFRDTKSGTWAVPRGAYFVMADFRAHSCDSRLWGALPVARVLGRVVEIIRPRAA